MNFSKREKEYLLEKDDLMRQFENELRQEKEKSDRLLSDKIEKFQQEIKDIKNENRLEIIQLDNKLKLLQNDYDNLQTRYRNRESRSEDLQRIQQLEEEMISKDRLVEQTKQEMLYFKREMLNREECYNQKFNRTPNVGVMNVLKNKDPSNNNNGNGGNGNNGNGPGQKKNSFATNGTGSNSFGVGGSGTGLGVGNSRK